MAEAMSNVGVRMDEQWTFSSQGSSQTSDKMVLLFPGLARMCDWPEYTQKYLFAQPGHAAVFLLQDYGRTSRRFNACHKSIASAANSHPGSVILGRQWFWLDYGRRLPCHQLSPNNGTAHAKYPRVQMQTFAIARTYQWAKTMLTTTPELFIRARLDSHLVVTPPVLPSELAPRAPTAIVFGSLARGQERFHGFPMVDDNYALVPRAAARLYFEAWRVWSGPLDCEHRCLASNMTDGRPRVGPTAGLALSGGECPLHTWVWRHEGQFVWRGLGVTFNPWCRDATPLQKGRQGAKQGLTGGSAWCHNGAFVAAPLFDDATKADVDQFHRRFRDLLESSAAWLRTHTAGFAGKWLQNPHTPYRR
mgnify:CR=1 FL=1